MNFPNKDRTSPSRVPSNSPTSLYDCHSWKNIQLGAGVKCAIDCVSCHNKYNNGRPRRLIAQHAKTNVMFGPLSIGDTPSNGAHMALILPCGHVAGWSCLEKDPSGKCPACDVTWKRVGEKQCRHPVGVSPYRPFDKMTDGEFEWMIPPSGYVPDVCRKCATLEVLRKLTRLVRGTMPPERGQCVYATDGVVNGFLQEDDLLEFKTLDIVIKPPMVNEALVQEARRLEETVTARYAGKTPKAETERVGAGRYGGFVFKLAGLPKPKDDETKREG